jgi:DNA polymerase
MSDKERAAHLAYLDAMGIQVWQRRHSSQLDTQQQPQPQTLTAPEVVAVPSAVQQCPAVIQQPADWDTLQAQVASCTRCELHKQRTQTVFGVGNRNATWMFIGEAPGADEDQQGEPFVGKAGQLLNLMFKSVGLAREEVYIANIVKCRPPGNRDPQPEEAACCEPYLKQQIAWVKPKIIIAVGRIAAQNLLKSDQPVGVLRNKQHSYGDGNIPLVVTYHPAYLLRSPQEKRKAWEDLLFVRKIVSAT